MLNLKTLNLKTLRTVGLLCLLALGMAGGARLLTKPVYFIRGVVDDTCLDALAPLAQAIDAAFQMTPDTPPSLVLGVIVRGGHRIEPMIGDTMEDGITYTYAGGLYRLFTYAPE